MKKSILHLVTLLKTRLLEFPALVTALGSKDLAFMDKLFAWIRSVEEILTTYNISEAAAIAGLRSKIISPRFSDNHSNSLKKIQLKIAAEVMYDLQHTVLSVSIPYEQKIAECRELIRQLLLIVGETKAIQYDPGQPFEKLIADIWQLIISNEQLKAGAIKLKTLLSQQDIQQLIAEEINLEDF